MNSLKRIQVKGFKSIREMDLEIRPLNVLIGANGAGKSNFISVFKVLAQIVEKRLQTFVAESGGGNSFLHFGRKVTREIEISVEFGINGYVAQLIPTSGDSLAFSKEYYWHSKGERKQQLDLGAGHRETNLRDEPRTKNVRGASDVLRHLQGLRVYHFHDTTDSAKLKQKGNISDNAYLRADASNLAAFLYLLREKHKDSYDLTLETTRLAAPFFADFVLRPDPHNQSLILLEWQEKNSDVYFNASHLSDGTLRFIGLATLLLQPDLPSTILIDEPELGLHPYAITLLASMLQSASTKTQVIVSTQSVPLVNQFAPEDIIVVDREDGQSAFKRQLSQELEGWMEEYSLGEIWEKNIIGGRP
jgi:predicted ATPase